MSVSNVGSPTPPAKAAPTVLTVLAKAPVGAAADGDTAAQEALETVSSKVSERSNGGFAAKSSSGVNKVA